MSKVIELTGQRFKDLTGFRFGRLTVVRRDKNKGTKTAWLVACDCGGETTTTTGHLNNGNTKSCGCLDRDQLIARNTTHNKSGTVLYRVWLYIKNRTQNKNSAKYESYGGRGIGMHPEWSANFEAFEAYMLENLGERPGGKSLDRKDNEKGYEPGNLRWATATEQASNTRRNVWFDYEGEAILPKELARRLNITYHAAYKKVKKGLYGTLLVNQKTKGN